MLKLLNTGADILDEDSEVSDMNFGEIKTIASEHAKPARGVPGQVGATIDKQQLVKNIQLANSDVAKVSDAQNRATKVLSVSYEQALSNNGVTASASNNQVVKAAQSLFDFEEVARNVLSFVSSVVNKAADDGGDETYLQSLIAGARKGVEQGVNLAIADLGVNTDTSIIDGAKKSKELILSGIDKLETRIGERSNTDKIGIDVGHYGVRETSTSFSLTTQQGDTVNIRLGNQNSVAQRGQISLAQNDVINAEYQSVTSQSNHFMISVEGNLDKQELQAIKDLVAQADEVAHLFYHGDIEQAFSQSQAMGFDREQISAFALQLTHSEQMQRYEKVQSYTKNDQQQSDVGATKSVAQYMNKVLDLMNQSQESLKSEAEYNELINALVNEMRDVQVPDLVSAINRFHAFNSQLLADIDGAILGDSNVEGMSQNIEPSSNS